MQIQFTEEQARELKRISAQRGVSVAAITREAVERHLTELGEPSPVAGRDRVMAIMGAFRSGQATGAVDHDRHLDEIYGDRGG